jgi:hypothetical protein
MNRSLTLLIIFSLALGLTLVPAAPAAAHITLAADQDTVSLAQLGVGEQSLRGPFDAAQLDFSLPATWQLDDGAQLQLNLATFFAGQAGADAAGQPSGAARSFGGTLQVVVNDVRVGTVLLDHIGERTVSVPISMDALTAPRRDDRYRLSLLLDTAEQCGLEQYTNLIIRSSSALVLPHRIVAPPTALAELPRPIVQRSFTPDAATIVTPDQPSAGELQAALAIAAGLGRMTDSSFELALRPVSRLTDNLRATTHLIVVGAADRLPLADRLDPQPLTDDDGDDGVVQMVLSPWNTANVALIATGRNDAAVIKAAQAISTGALRGAEQPDRAIVAGIQPATNASATGVDRTFAALGYDVQQMYGQGAQYAAYSFELPAGQVITEAAYLDLAYVHTALLDYDQSGMTVSLNGEPIASVRLDDQSTRLSSTRIDLPNSALRSGSNTLVIRGDLLPRAICTDPRGNGLWLTIRPESSLHLPLSAAPSQTAALALDLKHYPLPLTASPNLQRVAFVVPADDPVAWDVAMQIAVDLGRQSPGALADLAVVSGVVPEQLRRERDLVLVGRPSALPLIAELSAALPAPFAAGSDLAADPPTQVIYRRASDASVGYIELLAAPWDAQRSVLAALGSTDEGLRWAGAALTMPERRSRLSGNLAVVDDDQIEAIDTRPSAGDATEEAAQPEASQSAARPLSRMILLAAGSVALLLLIIVVSLLLLWRRRRSRRLAQASQA